MLESAASVKPLLVFGYGNLSRGDDALGHLLAEYVAGLCELDERVETLLDFQMQIEHALDLENRHLVLFADATVAKGVNAFCFSELKACRDTSYSTHAISPAAVMFVYKSIKKQPPPPCFLLAIKGEHFELGEPLSASAAANLARAYRFTDHLLANPCYSHWQTIATNPSATENST